MCQHEYRESLVNAAKVAAMGPSGNLRNKNDLPPESQSSGVSGNAANPDQISVYENMDNYILDPITPSDYEFPIISSKGEELESGEEFVPANMNRRVSDSETKNAGSPCSDSEANAKSTSESETDRLCRAINS